MRGQPFRHTARRRFVGPVVATAAGLAMLLLAVFMAMHGGERLQPTPITPDQDKVTATPSADRTFDAPQQTEVDLLWPADLSWVTVAGLELPVSATAGPRRLQGGRAQGFAQTPVGAVLAGLHLLVRTSPQVGPNVWKPTLHEQVVGPDAGAYADAVARGYAVGREQLQVAYGDPLAPIYASIAGIRIDTYHPDAASLRLLIEAPDGTGGVARAATVVQVSWSGVDWQLVAPPQGDWSTVRTLVGPALARGYAPLPSR